MNSMKKKKFYIRFICLENKEQKCKSTLNNRYKSEYQYLQGRSEYEHELLNEFNEKKNSFTLDSFVLKTKNRSVNQH